VRKKLFSEKSLLFRVIFALVNAELPLGFDAAPFACVFAPQKWGKLKEGTFGT
jgi:hypothetical protein